VVPFYSSLVFEVTITMNVAPSGRRLATSFASVRLRRR
jgi:hypothetical protein